MIAFLDSSALIGLLHRRDALHGRVKAHFDNYRGRIVTTEWVIVEVLNHLSDASIRTSAMSAVDAIRARPGYEVIPFDDGYYQRGIELFRSRPDKDWSLTDCISFTVMAERKLIDALTADHHFRQAGFNPIFAPSAV